MGYSHSFPCSITFTLAKLGDIRLRHLGYRQDIQKILLILEHEHAKTHHWPAIQILLETYQLYSGIAKEDARPLPWCPAR